MSILHKHLDIAIPGSGDVKCIEISRTTGRFLAAGSSGNDRDIHVFDIDNPQPLLTLDCHTSPPQSISFCNDDKHLTAGFLSGCIKSWDLECQVPLASFVGHKSPISSLDVGLHGFIASGSMDSTVKIYDPRKKAAVITYKGHAKTVNSVRFSPDGKWLVSASNDGCAKLWDLQAGKELFEFKGHNGAVVHSHFHPKELLLITAGTDRTLAWWDLEKFGLVCQSATDSAPIGAVAFHPDGTCAYSSSDNLRIHGWEPYLLHDMVPLKCAVKLSAIGFRQKELILALLVDKHFDVRLMDTTQAPLCSFPESFLHKAASDSTFVVKESQLPCLPGRFGDEIADATTPTRVPSRSPLPLQGRQSPAFTFQDRHTMLPQNAYSAAFKPSRTLTRSPTRQENENGDSGANDLLSAFNRAQPHSNSSSALLAHTYVLSNNGALATAGDHGAGDFVVHRATKPVSSKSSTVSVAVQQKSPRHAGTTAKSIAAIAPTKQSKSIEIQTSPPKDGAGKAGVSSGRGAPLSTGSLSSGPSSPDHTPDSLKMNAHDFLPSSLPPGFGTGNANYGDSTVVLENDVARVVQAEFTTLSAVYSHRLKSLQVVQVLWAQQGPRAAIEHAVTTNDLATLLDVLGVLNTQKHAWNLDICALVLPKLKVLLESQHQNYVHVACTCLRMIIRDFGSVIKNNVSVVSPSIGVDISQEERIRKCQACLAELFAVRDILERKQRKGSSVGHNFRELLVLLNVLD